MPDIGMSENARADFVAKLEADILRTLGAEHVWTVRAIVESFAELERDDVRDDFDDKVAGDRRAMVAAAPPSHSIEWPQPNWTLDRHAHAEVLVFGEDLKHALTTARSEAHRLRHESVRPEHCALGVLLTPSETVSTMLAGVPATELVSELEHCAGLGTSALSIHDLPYAEGSRVVIEYTVREARALGHEVVGSDHLLLGLLQVPGSLPQAVFEARGVTADWAREAVRIARSQGAV